MRRLRAPGRQGRAPIACAPGRTVLRALPPAQSMQGRGRARASMQSVCPYHCCANAAAAAAPRPHPDVRGAVVLRRLPPPLPQHRHHAQRREAAERQVEPRLPLHVALRRLHRRVARLGGPRRRQTRAPACVGRTRRLTSPQSCHRRRGCTRQRASILSRWGYAICTGSPTEGRDPLNLGAQSQGPPSSGRPQTNSPAGGGRRAARSAPAALEGQARDGGGGGLRGPRGWGPPAACTPARWFCRGAARIERPARGGARDVVTSPVDSSWMSASPHPVDRRRGPRGCTSMNEWRLVAARGEDRQRRPTLACRAGRRWRPRLPPCPAPHSRPPLTKQSRARPYSSSSRKVLLGLYFPVSKWAMTSHMAASPRCCEC
jgi:hypothetical protein